MMHANLQSSKIFYKAKDDEEQEIGGIYIGIDIGENEDYQVDAEFLVQPHELTMLCDFQIKKFYRKKKRQKICLLL